MKEIKRKKAGEYVHSKKTKNIKHLGTSPQPREINNLFFYKRKQWRVLCEF